MLLSVYLHDEVASLLRCYGPLEDVINRILDAGSEGHFDFMDKPRAPDRVGARRYDIDVTNDEYLSLLEEYPPNSCKISLRRIIYWFVENEMYDQMEWEVTSNYVDKNDRRRKNLLKHLRQQSELLLRVSNGDYAEKVIKILTIIKELENE